MKKSPIFLVLLCFLVILAGCGSKTGFIGSTGSASGSVGTQNRQTDPTVSTIGKLDPGVTESADPNRASQETPGPTESVTKEENDMLQIEISVGDQVFAAILYDNDAAKALIGLLPMTLNMSELNGNEKYYYLDSALPTDAEKPSGIREGDLMLYGNSCLVLFYKSFSTSYSYTPLGRVDDPSGLASALGDGSVTVTFTKS